MSLASRDSALNSLVRKSLFAIAKVSAVLTALCTAYARDLDRQVEHDMANSVTALAGRARLLSGAGSAVENPAAHDGQVHEAVTVLRPIRDRALGEQQSYLGIYVPVGLAVIIADESARVEAPDEFDQSLAPAASAWIRQMIAVAGPEIGALLADVREFVRRNGTSRQLMIHANELIGWWNEMQGVDKQQPKTVTDVLSPREITIIELIGRGQSNKEMARQLGIAPERR
jgi:hypothetical protein